MKNEFKIAFAEINELLKYFPQKYIDRIPKKLRDFLKENEYVGHKIEIDLTKKLEEQNLSSETKTLLTLIYRDYWATETRKRELDKIFLENDENYEKELKLKFDPDKIFEKNNEKDKDILVEYAKKNNKNKIGKEQFITIIESLKVKLIKQKDKK